MFREASEVVVLAVLQVDVVSLSVAAAVLGEDILVKGAIHTDGCRHARGTTRTS